MDVPQNILEYLRRVQAMAKTGLTYVENEYDRERYEELRDSTHEMLAQLSDLTIEQLHFYFDKLDSYPNPKVDVRGVVMRDGKILLVREKADGKWSIPGGWCDIGYSPAENIEKEIREECGLYLKANRLLAVWDKNKHDHPPALEHVYKLIFLCEDNGEALNPGHETLGADFFDPDNLPPLSEERITAAQITRLIALADTEKTDFD